jgi:hypothetical protein
MYTGSINNQSNKTDIIISHFSEFDAPSLFESMYTIITVAINIPIKTMLEVVVTIAFGENLADKKQIKPDIYNMVSIKL